METLDIYNSKKEKTGKIIKREKSIILEENEYFLYVKCCIINSKKEILITRRKLDKPKGGTWEPTGGCVRSGETSLQGIVRELREEIGLEVDAKELTLVKTIFEKRKYKSCIRDIYVLYKDVDVNSLTFTDGEVIDAKFVTKDEFIQMLKTKEIVHWQNSFTKEWSKLFENNK